jgi:hypothetical protein
MVAIVVLPLAHAPAGVASANCVVPPRHTFVAPVIGAMVFGLTVSVWKTEQPDLE